MINIMKKGMYALVLCALITQVSAETLHLGQISELNPAENSLVVGINRYFYNPRTIRLVAAESGANVNLSSLAIGQWVEVTYQFNGENGRNEVVRIETYRSEPEVSNEY